MLVQYRLREGTQRTLVDWTHADPGHDNASTGRDGLSGVVDFAVGNRTVRVSAQWVRSLIIDVERKRIILDLEIDAPLPDFPAKQSNASWRFFLETAGTAIPNWNIKATIPWLDKPLVEVGNIDQWLKRDGVTVLAQRGFFPFEKLGLGVLDVEEFNTVRVGLFVAPGDGVSRLAVVCMPDTRNVISHGSLTLANLTGLRFNLHNDSLRAALVGHLDASSARRDGLISPWVALFEWPLADAIQPKLLFDRIWNPLLHATAIGRRSSNAGRPWWPVARVSELKWNKGKRWQRLIFAPSAGSYVWRLLRFDFGAREIGASAATARATFAWYLDETSADPKVRTSGAAERVVAFSGKFQLPVEGEPPQKQLAIAGTEVAKLIDGILFDEDQALSAWTLGVSAFAGQAPAWLGFGSVQIKFQQPPAAPPLSAIDMRMVGDWTADTCDIYAQLNVSDLPCAFRMSNTGDPSPQSLVSQFDVVNAREDVLQRATAPVVCRLDNPVQSGDTLIDPDGSIAGKFHVRLQAEPNRDSLLQLQLTRNVNVRPSGRSLYLQNRPFNFAQLWPTDFDEEAGLHFGYWRSDDPEGPQWRLPDATVEFDLPPQTVAEEMERGNRFWDVNSTTSYIDPTKPIKFRFSPPTHVKVRPGWVDRRYHRNANNLSSILDGSRVEAFDTELLYPIRLRFEIDSDRKPAVDIAESGAFIGRPTSNLPGTTSRPRELAADLFPDDLAEWFTNEVTSDALKDFTEAYTRLRWEHSANRAQFVARIAQFHVHDPFLPDRQLNLSKGLKARFRTPDHSQLPGSMPPIRNPLPTGVAVEKEQREEIKAFLDPNMNWGEEMRDGALRAGAIHTLEFPSELRAVLREVGAVSAFIETLSFSTLGANAASSVSFDEGRTTFSVEVADGQVWRIRKIRLGRVALLWNKAKHVIVYERSVVPSEQFEGQQTDKRSLGWPILRKTEEYVEPIEMIRVFTQESEPELGSPGFAHSSEFITPRIYVDGAWGRDLGHGYEIPLWNTADASGFYPMPLAAINLHTATAEHSRAWHVHPEELYFYTNTEKGTGAESNNWMPFHGLDLTDGGPSRLDVCTNADLAASDVLDQDRVLSPRISSMRRKRFDLVVRTDGPANLQHGRGETEMLAAGIDVLSFARTAATSATSLKGDSVVAKAVKEVRKLSEFGARVDSLRDEADSFRRELPALFLKCQLASCKSLKLELEQKANKLFARLQDGAKHAFPDPRNLDLGVDSKLDEYLTRFRSEMYEWALPRIDAMTPILTEFRQLLAQAKQDTAGGIDEFNRHRDRLRRLFDVLELSVDAAGKKVVNGIGAPIQAVEAAVTALANDAERFSAEVASWIALTPEEIKAKAAGIRAQAEMLIRKSQSIKAPCLAAIRQRIEVTAQSVAEMALQIEKATAPKQLADAVKYELTVIMQTLERLAASLEAAPKRITKDLLDATQEGLGRICTEIDAKLNVVWNTVAEAKTAIDRMIELIDRGVTGYAESIEEILEGWRKKLIALLDSVFKQTGEALHGLTAPLVKLNANLRHAMIVVEGHVAAEIAEIEKVIRGLINTFETECEKGEADRKKALQNLQQQGERLVEEVTARVTGLITEAVDEETVRRVQSWGTQLGDYKDTVGKGIKLVKAIGNLPELPHLKFNADRVEYVFDDFKKQIVTSPFAARLREIDSGMKELGLAVPVRELMDQLVPDKAKLDFSKVFRDFGGMDFRKLFKRFRIPELDKDHIKITHGIEKETRSAWVKANVLANYPESRDVFAAGPLSVKMAAMSLQAASELRVDLDGKRKSVTKGELRGNWALDFKGAKLVTFRDVSVTLEGGRFDFNIAPEKVELHPSLKFISDIAKTLGEKVPPCIEVVRDSRGVITGARANLSTVIQKPLTMGAVKIGSLVLIGGLALTLEEGFKFAISGNISVGTKNAPIFVQINFLGGGMWLEAEARFVDGTITYLGNVGLALGSTECFNIGGVARGSYSLLLFAYAQFKSGGGGSFRGGLSITGCARILGIVNAYVLLMLEVVHGEGKPKGNGLLDVEVEVCKWYSVKVHKQVERSL